MRRLRALGATLLLGVVCVILLAVPTTQGAFVGRVDNTTNNTANGIYARCTTAAATVGGALFVHPFDEGSGTNAVDVSGNARPATYSGGYTLNQPGPCPTANGRSVKLNGTSGGVTNPTTQTNPNVFSVQIWFRTVAGDNQGGRLIGFGNGSGTTVSSSYDRHIYMTTAGRLVFGVYPNAIRIITSPASYNDGNWHHAVASLAPVTDPNPGMRLYVDGTLVASSTLTTTGENYTGRWRMGWDNLNTWTNAPTDYYFSGFLAYGAVFGKALTPAQVMTLYTAR